MLIYFQRRDRKGMDLGQNGSQEEFRKIMGEDNQTIMYKKTIFHKRMKSFEILPKSISGIKKWLRRIMIFLKLNFMHGDIRWATCLLQSP